MKSRPAPLSLVLVFLLASLACQLPALTAAPQPTATQPSPGSLLFEDDFSDRSVGWDSRGLVEGLMDYDAGGYRMVVNAAQSNFWSTPHKDLADVRIEVDEGKLGGPDENRVGLICRYSGSNFYFFIVTHDGFYGVGYFSGDQATGGQMELIGQSEMQFSPAINRGTNINHLRADCAGDALTLFVNGEQVTQVHDPRLARGDIGLLAGSFSQPGVDVIFDNFVVVQP
jgi:hypothetical protein